MLIKTIKANGNNNTFIIIIKKDFPPQLNLNKQLVKTICIKENPKVDGLIILDDHSFSVDYYNNDGTWETLCVNSLRCVGLVLEQRFKKSIFKVECGDGSHTIKIESSNNISISMPTPIYKTDATTDIKR